MFFVLLVIFLVSLGLALAWLTWLVYLEEKQQMYDLEQTVMRNRLIKDFRSLIKRLFK